MIITAFLIPDEAELSQLLHSTYIEKRASSIMGRQYGLLAWILLERLYLRVAADADAARCRRTADAAAEKARPAAISWLLYAIKSQPSINLTVCLGILPI